MSDKVVVTKSKLTAIANKIRSRLDVQTTYLLDDMPDAIDDIGGGGMQLICDIDFTESFYNKVTNIPATPRGSITLTEGTGISMTKSTNAVLLPIQININTDIVLEIEIDDLDTTGISWSGVNNIVTFGRGYEGKGGFSYLVNSKYASNYTGYAIIGEDSGTWADTNSNIDETFFEDGKFYIEINRYGYVTVYNDNGDEIKQTQYPFGLNGALTSIIQTIIMGGFHSNSYTGFGNYTLKSIKAYQGFKYDLSENNQLVYGYTEEENYVGTAIPLLTLDEGTDYSNYLSYNTTTKEFTVLQDFDGFIVLETYNYKSASSNPQGQLLLNDKIVLYNNWRNNDLARANQGRLQGGQNFSLKTGDRISPYNPSNNGNALENIYIYKC